MENEMIKILAIDDNRDNLISLKAIISEVLPHSVVYMELSGQEGIGSARKNEPDVILLDIVMPGMDGYEVCKTLKADEQLSEIPVIFLTALKGDKQSRILALEAGGEAFLAKPIDATELKAQILAMLKIKEAATYKRNQRLHFEELVQKRTEELKGANIAALNLLEDLNSEIEIRKQREEALEESERQYAFLAGTAFDLIKFTSIHNIYEYVARKLYELMEDQGIVAIVEYDSDSNRWKMQHLKGIGDKYADLSKIIGFDIRKLEGEISTKYYEKITSGKLEEVELDFPGLFNNKVSDKIGNTVMKLLSVDKMYCIAFHESEQIFGNITLVTKKNTKPVNADLIEAFVLQVTNYIKKQKSEEALRMSKELLSETEIIGKVGGWSFNIDTMEQKWTDEVYRIHEVETSPEPGVDAGINYYTRESRPIIDKAVQRAIEHGENYDLELEIITAKGNTRAVHTIGKADLKNRRIYGFFQDITERKQAEHTLFESEEMMRTSQSVAHICSYSTDLNLNEIGKSTWKCSPEFYKIFGIDVTYPHTIEGWAGFIHPDYREELVAYHEYVIKEKIRFEHEYMIIRINDGAERWVYGTGKLVFDEKGNPIRMYGAIQDITERKRAEEKLKLLNRAVEASSLSVIITDVNGVIDYINPHFSKVTGYSSEEVLGKNPKILKSNHHPKSFYKNLWDTVLSGKEWTGVILNKKKNGELYWEKAIVSPILDSNGKVINFVAIKEDITEKKRFEDTQKFLLEISVLATKQITATDFLAEVHQKLKKIIRSDNFYVALFNEADQTFSFPYHVDDYDSIEMNKPYDLRNSYTNHVLKTGQALIVTAQEQDEVKGNNRISAYSNQSSVWLGVPFKTKEGDKSNGVIAIQDYRNTEPYTETDKTIMEIIAHSIGSFIERIKYIEELVQARKNAEESEDKLRNLSEMQSIILRIASAYINMPQELVEDSINNSLKELGEFVQADRAYIFDYNWTRNVCNNTYEWCNEGINPEIDNLQNVPNEVIDYWVEAHKNGREMNIEDVMQLPPDDGVRQILEPHGVKSVLALPMMKRDKCIGFIGFDSVRKIHKYSEKEKTLVKIFSEMLVNIGNRIEIEKNLVQAKEKAEESDKLKTAFINNISHEIRTPLNGILGFGQILADPDLTTEEHEKFFKHIKKSSLRLMNTVTDYMDMAMLVSHTMEVNKKDIALEAVFGLIVEEARQLCEDKNLRFTLEIPKNAADLILHSDPELIQKIIKELIDNAIKFTDEGSIISGCDIKSDHIAFFVKDTGRGIDEDKRDLIFELFSQADTEMTRGYEGSGLGLSIAKGLVTLLGGKIQVQSEKGKGTVFTFTIPFKNQVKPTAPNKKTTPKTPDTKHPLILIAEDEESNLDYLTIVLERFGYRHLHAVNGQEAVDYCRQNPDISLVLMDIKMPVMHGDEATRQIRSFRPELPIIATTAHAQTGDEQRFLNAGCNDYVSKPIKKDSLLAIIRKYTG